MGIKNIVTKIADRTGGTVSKLAALSSAEIEKIDDKRNQYLSEMQNMNDPSSIELTGRLLAANSVEIYNAYLPQISTLYYPVENTVEYGESFQPGHNVRYINITKWVTNKEENSLEKLINVYEVLSKDACNIALVFNRKQDKTNVYLAITNTENESFNTNTDDYKKRLVDALKGNFPGVEYNSDGIGVLPCLNNELAYSVASASNVPAEKSEKFISQTIEKLLDGIVPKSSKEEYTIILLATPIQDVEERKLRLSQLYTALSPYASWQTNYTFTELNAFGSSATVGVNVGASAGSQVGQNQSDGISETNTDSTSETNSIMDTTSETKGKNSSTSGGANFYVHAEHSEEKNSSKTTSTAKQVMNTVGKSVAKGVSKTAGTFSSTNLGVNFGANFARASTVTATVGKNEGITQSHINYTIKHTLDVLEEQMKRYEESVALGMWDFAAYVLSEDVNIANNVAHTYVALTQGEKSYMSQAAINLWRGDLEDNKDTHEICKYLRDLRHPIFGLHPGIVESNSTYLVYPSVITATTALSGKELAYSLNFPRKSIAGLPVIECTEFGRNISSYEKIDEGNITLGNIFHMNHEELTSVELNVNSLASHTFITGSTGTGKSTTVYRILKEAIRKKIKFLVIEPAKGEYKHIFGNYDNISVFGTNPNKFILLRLNPFSFNEDIHVLEHIDRLIEIFNVCWPMYAAMPAVLKKAVEVSYKDCGWNLKNSTNKYSNCYYPTFADVARNVKEIINSSEYDDENKGAYKGSLLTRLESLTNGINGMIFTKDELNCESLFDSNAIIDLSRVGSSETKALLMGILILKLQEYRISTSGINEDLKHITVLEEAHNLLKRTSFEQSSESSNLLGKSVEMISNAIAEMRTYGEGFIIADQAPALLDMSAIRNTNTKIIMRLPDEGDRELVGRSANLNDEQIKELARLPRGVAAIYQNEWIEPILCKVKKGKITENRYRYTSIDDVQKTTDFDKCLDIATMISNGYHIGKEIKFNELKTILDEINISDSAKVDIMEILNSPTDKIRMTKVAPIMAQLFEPAYEEFKRVYSDTHEPKDWTIRINQYLVNSLSLQMDGQVRRDIIQSIITQYLLNEINNPKSLEDWKNRGNLR